MASESSFLVHVYFEHSIEHASVFASSFYPKSVRDIIESRLMPPFVPAHVLVGIQCSSTSLLTIKHILQEQHGIPTSVQYCFVQDKALGEPATLNLNDDTTLGEVWDADDIIYRKPEEVVLVLRTTAARLREIHIGSSLTSGLPSEIMLWRHYISALRYLVNKLDVCPDGDRRRELDDEIKKYQNSKSLSEQKMRTMLQDWERLVDRFDPVDGNQGDMEGDGPRELDFEAQFQRWHQQIQTILIKSVDEYRRKYGTLNTLTDIESRRDLQITTFRNMIPVTQHDGQRNERHQTIPTLKFEVSPISDPEKKIVAYSLPNESDPLKQEPDGFIVSSGILLWGQLPTVFAGSLDQDFQGNAATVPDMLLGGTIRRYPLRYRSAARVGNWRVRKAFSQPYGSAGDPTRHIGWVVYHEDVDRVEALERCSRVTGSGGISNGNEHVDKDVLYVGRYDWSSHSRPGATIQGFDELLKKYTQQASSTDILDRQLTTAEGNEQAELQSRLRFGYMLALDASRFSPAIGSLLIQDGFIGGGGRVLSMENAEGVREGFGAFVSMKGTEYELGWLVFSGRKHETFREADELVAIVYDGAYDGLGSHKFTVEV